MEKPRILWVGESSFLATGFGTYSRGILERLQATGKYDLAELGSYGAYDDPRQRELPWKFFPTTPRPGNSQDEEIYKRSKLNEFGQWKFEETCLEWRCRIVIDVRDPWMMEYQVRSPFRPFYHLVWMPTLDREPLMEGWVANYLQVDRILGYTDWGLGVLWRQSGGRCRIHRAAPPGADLQVYQPVEDREGYKQSLGLPPGCRVIGTTMRNQPRKYLPDLIECFALFLETAPDHLRQNTYLYLHTCYPDIGWDIPWLLSRYGVGHRVLMTYLCTSCQQSFPSFYQEALAVCRHCGRASAVLPHPSRGVVPKMLAQAYNLMDLFVLYSALEGFGVPLVEAAACGVPVMGIDYSATSEVVRRLRGIVLPPLKLQLEAASHGLFAIPDNERTVREWITFLEKPWMVRRRQGYLARQAVEERYTYDHSAKVWEEVLDELLAGPAPRPWDSPARPASCTTLPPAGLSNEEYVRWCIHQAAGRPDLTESYMALRMSRDLTWGMAGEAMGGIPFNDASILGLGTEQETQSYNRDKVLEQCHRMAREQAYWENRRVSSLEKVARVGGGV